MRGAWVYIYVWCPVIGFSKLHDLHEIILGVVKELSSHGADVNLKRVEAELNVAFNNDEEGLPVGQAIAASLSLCSAVLKKVSLIVKLIYTLCCLTLPLFLHVCVCMGSLPSCLF